MTNTQKPDLPVPCGACADDWPSLTDDGVPVRSLLWETFDTGKVRVEVCGLQYRDDGWIERGIVLYDDADNTLEGLGPTEARGLAEALADAADALERLT